MKANMVGFLLRWFDFKIINENAHWNKSTAQLKLYMYVFIADCCYDSDVHFVQSLKKIEVLI